MIFPIAISTFVFAKEPMLTPDGLVWLGPLGPNSTQYGDVVGVDPSTGKLYVENNDGYDQIRKWVENAWALPDSSIEGVSYEQDEDLLNSATDASGVVRRYKYDASKRLVEITWGNGQRLAVKYEDNSDRIARLEGPGADVWTFKWGSSMEVIGPGSLHYYRSEVGSRGNRTVTVKDILGRQVRINYAHGKIKEIVDPQGLPTRFNWGIDTLAMTDFAGRQWRLGWHPRSGHLSSYSNPAGAKWSWKWSDDSKLKAISDPTGRKVSVQNKITGDVYLQGSRQLSINKNTNGWVKEIGDALGVLGRFKRDRHGQIVAFEDALGGEIEFKRTGTWLSEVYDRSDAKWVFEKNSAGMLQRIVTPMNLVFTIERNARGEPIKVLESGQGATLFDRDALGRITSMKAANGQSLKFEWEPSGLKRILRDDGTSIQFDRNSIGEIMQLSVGDKKYPIVRGGAGEVISVGDVLYAWDQSGQIKSIQNAAGMPLKFQRDASGLITSLQRGEYNLTIQRDSLGRPIQWREPKGESLSLKRDIRGQIVSTVEDELSLTLDSRGWVSEAKYKNKKWKWLRDSSGRPTRILDPEGRSIGVDRDETGVVRHIRYPDGAMLQLKNSSTEIKAEFINENGDKISSNAYRLDGNGQLSRIDTISGPVYFRRDPLGKIVAVEGKAGLIWSQSLDSVFDQHGAQIVYDEDGRTLDAQLPANTPLWGRMNRFFSHQRDNQKRLNKYVSNEGKGFFRFDDMDRLQSICTEGWSCWRFKYDPRGFLRAFSPPGKPMVKLKWRSDILASMTAHGGDETEAEPLLAIGKNEWLQGPLGMSVKSSKDKTSQFNHDMLRKITLLRHNEGTPTSVASGMGDYYVGLSQRVVDGDCRVQLPLAGPGFCGDSAYLPLNNERMDGVQKLPWSGTSTKKSRFQMPNAFRSQSIWRDPIRLIADMNLINLDGDSWVTLRRKESLVSYIDPSIEPKMTIAPALESVPLPMDDLSALFILPALRGDKDPTPSQVVSYLLRREFEMGAAFDTAFFDLIWWIDDRKQYPGLALLFSIE